MNNGVQLENGYTRIANEILDVLAKTSLNGTQRRVLDVVFRQTYGYHRKEHNLSLTFIAKATGIHKKQIQRELSALIERNIIIVDREATFSNSRVLRFNKNYTEWLDSIQVTNSLPPNEIDTETGNKLVTSTGSEIVTQKKKDDKENIKENIYSSVIDYLNFKCNTNYRATTGKTRSLIKARVNEGFVLEDFKKVIDIKYVEWFKTDMAKYLRPETLFGTKFESYLNQKSNLNKGGDKVGKFGNAIRFDVSKGNREIESTENLEDEIKKLGLM
jgi:phage replication O-like protein O